MIMISCRPHAELKSVDVGYAELARRLTEMGLPDTERSVIVKINYGASPGFLFAVMKAIRIRTLRVEDWSSDRKEIA
jgi:hypothetical protein